MLELAAVVSVISRERRRVKKLGRALGKSDERRFKNT
jgi:hypothetical protein